MTKIQRCLRPRNRHLPYAGVGGPPHLATRRLFSSQGTHTRSPPNLSCTSIIDSVGCCRHYLCLFRRLRINRRLLVPPRALGTSLHGTTTGPAHTLSPHLSAFSSLDRTHQLLCAPVLLQTGSKSFPRLRPWDHRTELFMGHLTAARSQAPCASMQGPSGPHAD